MEVLHGLVLIHYNDELIDIGLQVRSLSTTPDVLTTLFFFLLLLLLLLSL